MLGGRPRTTSGIANADAHATGRQRVALKTPLALPEYNDPIAHYSARDRCGVYTAAIGLVSVRVGDSATIAGRVVGDRVIVFGQGQWSFERDTLTPGSMRSEERRVGREEG